MHFFPGFPLKVQLSSSRGLFRGPFVCLLSIAVRKHALRREMGSSFMYNVTPMARPLPPRDSIAVASCNPHVRGTVLRYVLKRMSWGLHLVNSFGEASSCFRTVAPIVLERCFEQSSPSLATEEGIQSSAVRYGPYVVSGIFDPRGRLDIIVLRR